MLPLFLAIPGPRARKSSYRACLLRLTISRWKKLVGKSGDRFEAVCNRLREIDLPRQAKKYANLEKRLVKYKVDAMLAEGQE